jgi:hypothetical protein
MLGLVRVELVKGYLNRIGRLPLTQLRLTNKFVRLHNPLPQGEREL